MTLKPHILLAALSLCAVAAHGQFQVDETTIAATHAALRDGRTTCRKLAETYLKRIAAYDQSTRLNTAVTMNPTLLADADRMDRDFRATHTLKPLECIAFVVKDNYDTAGLQTTGGSLAMKGVVPSTDAFMVKKIREAGALILYKSNMAEWAFSPVLTESSIAGCHPQSLCAGPRTCGLQRRNGCLGRGQSLRGRPGHGYGRLHPRARVA